MNWCGSKRNSSFNILKLSFKNSLPDTFLSYFEISS
jgi:hypothetical protein